MMNQKVIELSVCELTGLEVNEEGTYVHLTDPETNQVLKTLVDPSFTIDVNDLIADIGDYYNLAIVKYVDTETVDT